jgi:hypothetical protein
MNNIKGGRNYLHLTDALYFTLDGIRLRGKP